MMPKKAESSSRSRSRRRDQSSDDDDDFYSSSASSSDSDSDDDNLDHLSAQERERLRQKQMQQKSALEQQQQQQKEALRQQQLREQQMLANQAQNLLGGHSSSSNLPTSSSFVPTNASNFSPSSSGTLVPTNTSGILSPTNTSGSLSPTNSLSPTSSSGTLPSTNTSGILSPTTSSSSLMTPQQNSSGSFQSICLTPSANAPLTVHQLSKATVELGNQTHFKNLCLANEGVLYARPPLQIGLKSKFDKSMGQVMLYYGNGGGQALTNFTTTISDVNYLLVQAQPITNTLNAGQQLAQMFQLACTREFNSAPSIHIEYTMAGSTSPTRLSILLPVVVSKFITPESYSAAQYLHRWKQIPDKENLYCAIFKAPNGQVNMEKVQTVLKTGLHLSIISGVDPNPSNLVCAGTFHYNQNQSSVRCFVRLETNTTHAVFRLSVKSESKSVTSSLAALIIDSLGDFSTIQVQR